MRFCKILFGAIFFISIFMGDISHGADVVKIGVVNFQKIIDTSNPGKTSRAAITKKFKSLEADLKKKGVEIEERQKQLAKNALVMKKEVRDQKEREIRISINDHKVLQRQYTQDIKNLEDRLIKRIQTEILKMVGEIGKKEGYLLIIEKRSLLYAPKSVDITDNLIRQYNAQFAKDSKTKKK